MTKDSFDDFDIVFEETPDTSTKKTLLIPQNANFQPSQIKEDIKIYVSQAVYEKIEEYSKTDLTRELGGVLLGDYVIVKGSTTVIIETLIKAEGASSKSASIQFTHDTWEYIFSEKDSKYPDKIIVGWFHTHPRFGIFLSNMDKFICDNFFSEEWQVAYVVDPVSDKRGFFYRKNNELQNTGGFYSYSSENVKAVIPKTHNKTEADSSSKCVKKEPLPLNRFVSIGPYILICCFIIISILLLVRVFKLEENNRQLKNIKPEQIIKYIEKEPAVSELEAQEKVYVVSEGDTLWKISEKVYGVKWAYTKIAYDNRINNINLIYPDQQLIIKPLEGQEAHE